MFLMVKQTLHISQVSPVSGQLNTARTSHSTGVPSLPVRQPQGVFGT